jgi:uncharacterized protein
VVNLEYKLTFSAWKDGLKEGEFLGLKCKDCGAVTFPPRKVCSNCASENMDIVEVGRKGKIITYTICVVVPTGFTSPKVVAIAELEEGCRIMGDIIYPEPEKIDDSIIGKTVEMGYMEIPGDYMTGGDNRFPLTLKIID